MQRQPAGDPGRPGHPDAVGDLLQIEHLQPVEDAQVHGFFRGVVQVLHVRAQCVAQQPEPWNPRAQLERAHAEPVVRPGPLEHSPFEKLLGKPMDRSLRDAGTAGQLGQRQVDVIDREGLENEAHHA
jgi:hypothetical protein